MNRRWWMPFVFSTVLVCVTFKCHGRDTIGEPQISREPEIAEVFDAALRYAHLDAAEVGRWKKRVSLSVLLPRFQVDYDRRLTSDINVNVDDSVYVGSSGVVVGPETSKYVERAGAGHAIGVRAMWRLDELLFSRDQLNVSAEARALMRESQSLLAEVNREYHRRLRAQRELKRLQVREKMSSRRGTAGTSLFLKEVEFREATAALDALTGGWFGRRVNSDEGGGP